MREPGDRRRPDLQEKVQNAEKSQRPEGTVAGSSKRLASRVYQVKAGHCLSGRYLRWT